jgi:preprotein translocase subunit SecE
METQKMTRQEKVLLTLTLILSFIYFWVDGLYINLITN